ncbi:PepSY domain-containing protein [Thioalkalivibrio sp. XN8]|uniref:PepSY domain-containing protein n=1 Tax=Thioalkalivibrio sp. XN8 TaxID=2712863 RepID=UPI001F0E971D|nr:PepSY domain-containing protein [Thioalkalivibrio sp. XN8]
MDQSSTLRRRPGRACLGLAAALLCALAPGLVPAQARPPADPGLRLAQADERVSLAAATRMVQQRFGGQVLRAETRRDDGRVVHRIRVLTEDGRVRTVQVDAATGRMY